MTAIDVHAVSAGTMHAAALEAMCAHTGGFLRLIKSFGEPLLVSLGPSLLRVSARTLTVRAYSSQSLELQHVIGAMNLGESSQFVSQFTSLVGESWQGFTFYYDVVDELSEGDYVSLQVIVMASLCFVSFLDACVQVEISWSSEDGSHRTRVFPSRIALASSLPVVLSKLSPFACCMAIAKQATAKANENDAASAKQYVNACVRSIAQQFAPSARISLSRYLQYPRSWVPGLYSLYLLLRGPLLGVVLQHHDDMHCARALFLHASAHLASLLAQPYMVMMVHPDAHVPIPPLDTELVPDRVICVDAGDEIFLWIGGQAAASLAEQGRAFVAAAAYAAASRFPVPHITIVHEGGSAERGILAVRFLLKRLPFHIHPDFHFVSHLLIACHSCYEGRCCHAICTGLTVQVSSFVFY
jgi:hypothetical protein